LYSFLIFSALIIWSVPIAYNGTGL
jgi:hypothetical protein